MKYEITVFMALVALGLFAKRLDWRGFFFLGLFICTWVFINWKKG